jgi:hypothetical protein
MRIASALLLTACVSFVYAAEPAPSAQEHGSLREKFTDPQDGKFDMSAFLASAYGFVPIGSVLTEPAIGYGGALGLIFIQPNTDPDGQPMRPNLAAAAGFATENGSWGGAGGHSGLWNGGRLKTLFGAFYTSLNLEFFGNTDVDVDDRAFEYNLLGWGSLGEADWKIGETSSWFGLRYVYADVTAEFDLGNVVPSLQPLESDQRLSGLTPLLSYDTRDNIFTPTRGVYAEASIAVFSEALGGDSDFELSSLMGLWYHPLSDQLSLGVRGDFTASSGDIPFYLRPYVQLRGIQSLRLQGENRAQAEIELRWQRWGRYSLVAFAGGGTVWKGLDDFDNERSTATGGIGMRYLLARLFGLHMGVDVGFGPDDPILYIQFGNAWFRP